MIIIIIILREAPGAPTWSPSGATVTSQHQCSKAAAVFCEHHCIELQPSKWLQACCCSGMPLQIVMQTFVGARQAFHGEEHSAVVQYTESGTSRAVCAIRNTTIFAGCEQFTTACLSGCSSLHMQVSQLNFHH